MATEDYYDIFKVEKFPLNPHKDRKYNYNQLTQASSHFTQLQGDRADIMLNHVKEAQKVFNSDSKYKEFRKSYIEFKLKDFLEGALLDKNLYENDYNRLVIKGEDAGIEQTEVDKLIKLEEITKLNKERPETVNKKSEKELEEEKEKLKQKEIRIKQEEIRRKQEEDKFRKQLILKMLLIAVSIILIVGLIWYFFLPDTQISNGEPDPGIELVIEIEDALRNINITPPEYLKVEEAVSSFKANKDKPGAKEGLIKATDIYIKWGDDAPTPEESRKMYQKALECNNSANGNKAKEIKAKLEELYY